MARFLIDTLTDPATGHVFAEIRSDPQGDLLARSGPVYASHEEAGERVAEAISKAWPEQPVDPVYPANGS
ncbi:hypothetical protein LWE61_01345 [Sphingobium sufflavum]|uniref:hypothetical protein n=1 Tax=Sphingobium sufflavum TaxID=1129547 RepID=UPI001F210003|nr:hypothetical protein [Sphingobium sufflavum]MCE7795194.1 hypothetical protein [Sphingobium sufflavum]